MIAMMADLVAGTGRAERDGLEAGLLKREEPSAVGMPGDISIPRCRSGAVHAATLALVRLNEPVDFGAADGPADVIIATTAPEGNDDQHLKLLAQLSRTLFRPEFLVSLLGVIIGLMMWFDLGGPLDGAAFEIMVAVMAAGMVPPLAVASSTLVRRRLSPSAPGSAPPRRGASV